ncbi:hypothetical protein Pyrde_1963 [Pyrodictium delaneyi]|uniref:Uncharacterized protein n=1 Tax=Pyrodictium delaneyi TaxID=1273541 RepID=A0A0P0N6C0_9CREN|nr:hypothetical protein [Pyrodictium delaneyi]ALL02006.1 hypothetical protein Pyrde_1963 [Pyrodictium delaneyi]OWJ54830.1 hypothetical protein Pdsh_03700 [Pyrodictium delaneyi]
MVELKVELLGSEKTEEGLYAARLEIEYEGRQYQLKVPRLVREPARLNFRLKGDYLLVELFDREDKPLATCCIHKGHLEEGCLDCPSLIPPPHREGSSCK